MVTSLKSPPLVDNDFQQNEAEDVVQTNSSKGAAGRHLAFAKTGGMRNGKRAEAN
jgi:hypothetical protein